MKDRCIYKKKIEGRTILLLRQVDDICCACTVEQGAMNVYNLIGTKIKFQSEQDKGDIPFDYLRLVQDYNGTDLVQNKKYIAMNCSNYIARFLKSHGWDVASDQLDTAPTTVTNSRTWDNWIEAKRLADLGKDSTDNKNTDVTHTTAASITTTGLLSVNTTNSAPDLSYDELVALKLKNKNENRDFSFMLTPLKGEVNEYNLEECMKSSMPIAPIPSGSIEQMFRDKGAPEDTTAYQVLKTSSKYNYQNVLGELMYVYITFCPDIGYAITTLSKFSLEPSAFHYKPLCGVAKYLQGPITWGICFNWPSPLNLDKLYKPVPNLELANSDDVFPVDINRPVLQVFTDAAFGNDLTRRRSTISIVYIYYGGS